MGYHMKTKNPEELAEMIQPLLKNNTPPYAEDMSELAEKLMGHVRSSLANNDMDLIEAAGRTALGVMLEQYASGDLEKRDAIAFLRNLADKKTPAPVQKVEQFTQIDMNILLKNAIQDNPNAVSDAMKKAEVWREQIKAKYGMDDTLQLPANEDDIIDAEFVDFEEPDELKKVRK